VRISAPRACKGAGGDVKCIFLVTTFIIIVVSIHYGPRCMHTHVCMCSTAAVRLFPSLVGERGRKITLKYSMLPQIEEASTLRMTWNSSTHDSPCRHEKLPSGISRFS
ncbi:conserved hypothetical protein, partial [Coccidioides posadasii str. Silveira]